MTSQHRAGRPPAAAPGGRGTQPPATGNLPLTVLTTQM